MNVNTVYIGCLTQKSPTKNRDKDDVMLYVCVHNALCLHYMDDVFQVLLDQSTGHADHPDKGEKHCS